MEEIRTYLRPGEQILWQGRTGRFSLLEADIRWLVLGKWACVAAAAAALAELYVRTWADWKPGMLGVIFLGALLLLFDPVAEWDELRCRRYWITDQRVLAVDRDGTLQTMERSDVDACRLIRRPGGRDCLVLGGAILDEAEGQLRYYACNPSLRPGPAGTRTVGMVLYGVCNADEAAACLGACSET